MTYRLLKPEEWHLLIPLFPSAVSKIPSPLVSTCAVAQSEDGALKGALFMQLALHCEPLILENPHVSFLRLHETLESAYAGNTGLSYYAFSDLPVVAGMAEKAGMAKTDYTLWRKEIT